MTERQRDMLAYGVVALAAGNLLLWIIPACTPEYPGYGVPASLLPNIAAGFMLALSLLGLARAALASRAERRETATAPGPVQAAPAKAKRPGNETARVIPTASAPGVPAEAPARAAEAALREPVAGEKAGADGAASQPEKAEATPLPTASRIQWLHLARFLIPCALLMPAMSWLGFIPAGVIFMAVIQCFCGQRRPLAFGLVAVLPVLAVYAVMRFGLGVPMP